MRDEQGCGCTGCLGCLGLVGLLMMAATLLDACMGPTPRDAVKNLGMAAPDKAAKQESSPGASGAGRDENEKEENDG